MKYRFFYLSPILLLIVILTACSKNRGPITKHSPKISTSHKELRLGNPQKEKLLAAYNQRYLDLLLGITAAATLLSYVLFCVSEYAIARIGTPYLIGTSIFVAFGLFRYLQLVIVDETPDAPAELVLRDPMIRGAAVCWVAAYGALFYW